MHRQVDDFGIGSQLIDGRYAIRIDCDQADFQAVAHTETSRQLGDCCCLADAGRADQHRNLAATPLRRDWFGAANLTLDECGQQ